MFIRYQLKISIIYKIGGFTFLDGWQGLSSYLWCAVWCCSTNQGISSFKLPPSVYPFGIHQHTYSYNNIRTNETFRVKLWILLHSLMSILYTIYTGQHTAYCFVKITLLNKAVSVHCASLFFATILQAKGFWAKRQIIHQSTAGPASQVANLQHEYRPQIANHKHTYIQAHVCMYVAQIRMCKALSRHATNIPPSEWTKGHRCDRNAIALLSSPLVHPFANFYASPHVIHSICSNK